MKCRNLKENLTFDTFRPIALVVVGGEESQDQERDHILSKRRQGKLRLY